MALADPCLKKEWEEWKREMEENRKRRWRNWVRCWTKAEVSDNEQEQEDDLEEVGAEKSDIEEEDVSEDGEHNEEREWREGKGEEGENESGRKFEKVDEGEEEGVKEAEEMEFTDKEGRMEETRTRKDKEENEVEKKSKKDMDKNHEKEVNKEEERVDKGEEEVKWKESKVNESKREGDEKERATQEAEEIEEDQEEGVMKSEIRGDEELDENHDNNMEKDELGEWEEEGEKWEEIKFEVEKIKEKEIGITEENEEHWVEVEKDKLRENQANKRVNALSEKSATEAAEKREESDDKDDEELEEDGKMEVKEAEVKEEQEGECEFETVDWVNKKVDENEYDDNEEEPQKQEQNNQTVSADGNFRGSIESETEDSDLSESEDEHFNFRGIKNKEKTVEIHQGNLEEPLEKENSSLTAPSCQERDKEEVHSEEMADGMVADNWKTESPILQDNDTGLPVEEEESTDDEEAECSVDEHEDSSDEDVVKAYHKEDFVTDLFCTLTEFRDRYLLTDLILTTVDGKSVHVHAPVLAAVSSHIRASLNESKMENIRANESKEGGIKRWSLSLGPEVDNIGLEAIVEFAYTGLIPSLCMDTVHQIRAVAESLGAIRVLDLCTEEEERSKNTEGQRKEDLISAEEQMVINLQSIKQLWTDRVGCDVTLEVLGGLLHVHRIILAVCSDYFRSMFTLGMKESHQSCVSLPFLLASELQFLLDCSYSGALPLSWSCVFEITSIALQLQYQPALSLCISFLQQEINPHSCLDVVSFAEAYEMTQLQEAADDFVLRQFQKVACTLKFKDLTAKQLLRYLNSHSLCVSSELVVFRAVVAWIQAKPKKRLKLAKELMKSIHFPLMTFKEFKEVQSLNMWTDHSLADLYEAVFEEFCANETEPQCQWRIYLPKENLVLIGGDQTSDDLGSRSISRELWFGNSLRNHTGIRKAMEWRKLGEMPDPARFRHEVAVLYGKLYIFGGKKYYGTYDTLNSVYRFDPLQNSWESLAEMREKRCSFSVVVLDGKIYAIGGHCDPNYLDNVERYCPTTNSWSFTRPLDLPLSAHVAKVLQGQVFVSGGLSSDYQCLASMFVYHPQTGSTYLANMIKPRAHHCMETLGRCLYVAGGITMDEKMTVVDQLACEVYNLISNSWDAFTSLPVPHVGAGSAVMEGKFYVLGGYSQEDYSDTTLVHRYDPAIQRWENMGKMPRPNNDIRASVLCLPQHLRL